MSDGEEITHSRTCDECGAETYQYERCHECGDVPWEIVTDGGKDGERTERPEVLDHVIGTEAGAVSKRFESWDDAAEWRENGHARNLYGMPKLIESGDSDV